MSDIIHLLPDSVANQIAAGEVVQRPSSVVKELVENAIDAGATTIEVNIKDAGRTLIQIIDNGKGMSETDARMAFERHATSKIRQAEDLFHLHTMGFRGEALASIAAVAQVELRTRRQEDEIGVLIEINGSTVERQEPVSCSVGTMLSVKNLFYNIPARRKFLKSNTTEFGHIENEFSRIAIIYPHISFTLRHNDTEIFVLPESSLRQRIITIFGKSINTQLLPVETKTSLVKISGFIGKPESAKKHASNQFFFVNGRYMRHPYFHRAVMMAFEKMLVQGTSPNYFLSFEIDPSAIDVNIHPTKTEIKFENEQAIFSILLASVREALGKFNIVPGIDFDQDDAQEIPVIQSGTKINVPSIEFNPEYNPFKQSSGDGNYQKSSSSTPKNNHFDWEKLYTNFETEAQPPEQTAIELDSTLTAPKILAEEVHTESCDYFQYKGKYILTSVKSGLMFIDQHRAHQRILFEQYLHAIGNQRIVSQQLLFPELIELSAEDALVIEEILDELAFVGFDIDQFGKNTYRINGTPTDVDLSRCVGIIEEMIVVAREQIQQANKSLIHEQIAQSLARATAIPYGKILSIQEMTHLVEQLFACENHKYSPSGKVIISILEDDEIGKKF
jgi:DNA mismatch repair protein MutL